MVGKALTDPSQSHAGGIVRTLPTDFYQIYPSANTRLNAYFTAEEVRNSLRQRRGYWYRDGIKVYQVSGLDYDSGLTWVDVTEEFIPSGS
jgi:hypothetical protein